jgi:hypothetical protein
MKAKIGMSIRYFRENITQRHQSYVSRFCNGERDNCSRSLYASTERVIAEFNSHKPTDEL